MIASVCKADDYCNRKHVEGWDPPEYYPTPTIRLRAKIASMIRSRSTGKGRTELDSHANMMVFGSNCELISLSGKTVEVGAFSESAGGLSNVPIADVIVALSLIHI